MGEVIEAAFGTEREWQQTREKLCESMAFVGGLFSDEEALMRAKAHHAYLMLRNIIEHVPPVQLTTTLPKDLTQEQLDLVLLAVKTATLKGIEAAMQHSVEVMMGGIYDLCTSKLKASTP